jgi:M-phase inducer tyrosine phosphatase
MDQPECADLTTFPYINRSQLRDILEGKYGSIYNRRYIIDCRFAYEYAGGHIQGAENHWAHETIDSLLFRDPPSSDETVLILHCEYSECRAPRMCVSL